jgi:Domain of unknown function (DUF4386)
MSGPAVRVLPWILGVFLFRGGLGYMISVFWEILGPGISFPDALPLPAAVGEIGICLWLLRRVCASGSRARPDKSLKSIQPGSPGDRRPVPLFAQEE